MILAVSINETLLQHKIVTMLKYLQAYVFALAGKRGADP